MKKTCSKGSKSQKGCSSKKARLELSNGVKLEGRLIGADVASSGEMVFSTGMLGYAESIADPSYLGQILVFSFPLIGNHGVPVFDEESFFNTYGPESQMLCPQGLIMSQIFDEYYHYVKGVSLEDWMKENSVPGIAGIDTRYLVQMIRDAKTPLKGWIIPEGKTKKDIKNRFEFLNKVKSGEYADPSKYNLLPSISVSEPQTVGKGAKKVAVIDCGVKWNAVRMLAKENVSVEILPWDYDFSKVKADAWLISDGPGDPKNTGSLAKKVTEILKQNKPVLGIGLGHQILALAAGGQTKRMAQAQISHNQPVFICGTPKAYMTVQNHYYTVSKLPKDFKVWLENANDKSVEGIKHKTKPFTGVQFHPEPTTAQNDTGWIVTDFVKQIKK
ncbi:MAG: glutamine-hydrolyzing carbamoyl-phosphate synthase small subunit [Elusimicrobia bacterium]|nr:glutamine-hydrolyzing carbamoyl-phosphate synthase small subunit [Elusimicrobiota bacterium]